MHLFYELTASLFDLAADREDVFKTDFSCVKLGFFGVIDTVGTVLFIC